MEATRRSAGTVARDMAIFGRYQLLARDPDCEYHVMRVLTKDLPLDDALWLDLLYVAYTHIPSAYTVYKAIHNGKHLLPQLLTRLPRQFVTLPTSVERRGLRNPIAMEDHLESLLDHWKHYGSMQAWLSQGFNNDPFDNWRTLQRTLQSVKQNGRWAAYKVSELLYANHRDVFNIAPPDMAMDGSSGPRWGLGMVFPPELVGNSPEVIRQLDAQAAALSLFMRSMDLHLSMDELETLLCNYHSLAVGRYYVGHDIDLIQAQLLSMEVKHPWTTPYLLDVWKARREALPEWTLGEVNGWNGIRTELNSIYVNTGVIDWWRLGHKGGPL